MNLFRIANNLDNVVSRFKADPATFVNVCQIEINKIQEVEPIEVLDAVMIDNGDLIISVQGGGIGSWEIAIDPSISYSEFIRDFKDIVLNTIQAYEEGPM